jgi:hypothetical protein
MQQKDGGETDPGGKTTSKRRYAGKTVGGERVGKFARARRVIGAQRQSKQITTIERCDAALRAVCSNERGSLRGCLMEGGRRGRWRCDDAAIGTALVLRVEGHEAGWAFLRPSRKNAREGEGARGRWAGWLAGCWAVEEKYVGLKRERASYRHAHTRNRTAVSD